MGKRSFYTDEEFPANENSLGQLAGRVDHWRRPELGEVLASGGINADDVKQGAIGDCYLISSLGVLGEKRIMSALGSGEGEKDEQKKWTNRKGAYMVRFYKFGKEFYIIVDDQIPVDENN